MACPTKCTGPYKRGTGGYCGCECKCCPPPTAGVIWRFCCSSSSSSSSESSSSDSPKKQFEFLKELFEKRGIPSIGGLSYQLLNKFETNNITMSFYEINPLTSRTEHYYNTRNNILYRKKLLSKNYAIWQPISLV